MPKETKGITISLTQEERARKEWRRKENICIAISVTCSVTAAIISILNILG